MSIEALDHYPAELDDLALQADDSSFYQTSGWITSVEASFPHMRARCLVNRQGGRATGYLPYFIVRRGPVSILNSMPFGTYGGPVTRGGDSCAGALLEAYVRMTRAMGVLEVSWTDFWNRAGGPSGRVERYATRIVDLTAGFESVWRNGFEKSKRRQVRKAEREGLTVVESADGSDIDAYYAIYNERIDEWAESFRYPKKLFEVLVGNGRRHARLFLVKQDDAVLGGHLNFYFKDTVIAWNGVTRRDSRGQQASTLLYSRLIQHACEHGFKRYNLGSSLGKRSLERYKASLGGAPHPYAHHRVTSCTGRVARLCKKLLSRTKR
jgi:CelD/BcsL family acetyltransferase involved in cellulose biosynthesis